MYLRRLWLLALCIAAGGLVMAGQVIRLTLVRGADLRVRAETLMVDETWTPAARGRILDRKGRVLAEDRPTFEVRARFAFIAEGRWAEKAAETAARTEAGETWDRMSPDARRAAVDRLLPEMQRRVHAVWCDLAAVLGVPAEEMEEQKAEITSRVQVLSSLHIDRKATQAQQRLEAAGHRNVQLNRSRFDVPIAEELQAHPIAQGLSDAEAFEVRRLAERAMLELSWRSGRTARGPIEVVKSSQRMYPLETTRVQIDRSTFPSPVRPVPDEMQEMTVDVAGVATHILGWMKPRQAEDLADARFVRPRLDPVTRTLDYGHYQDGDLIGAAGMERSQERALRGLRGRVTRHADTDAEDTVPPVAGGDVTLSIDVNVQAKVQALMQPEVGLARLQPWHLSMDPEQWPKLELGSPIYGAAAVLEIESGELLALVSTPSFTREQRSDAELWRDPVRNPAINKAISGRYPPGSIIKPLVLTAAVTEGVHSLSTAINCTGHFYPGNANVFRCWIFKQSENTRTHNEYYPGGLHAPEGIAASCNIYFYTLGSKLGLDRLGQWYRRFGIGEVIDLGLGGEYAGYVRDAAAGRGHVSDAINMAIGQGPVDYTPLHAADIYATIARGGLRIKPRLLMNERPVTSELRLDTAAVDAAVEGLRQAVSEPFGTGHHLTLEGGVQEPIFQEIGVTVAGKTGTAEAPAIVGEDPDGEGPKGRPVLRDGDHSWFVVMVGPRGKPAKYVVAVMMEYAGSGGRVSGPIANQIIHVLKQEGYL